MSFALRFLFCCLWLGAWHSAIAVEVSEGPVVTATENSAIIRWGTDVECGTTAKVGLSMDALLRKAEGGVGVKHEVSVNQLLAGTKYYFSIGTAKKALQSGSFITQAAPAKGTKGAAGTKEAGGKKTPNEVKPAVKPTPAPAAKPAPAPTPEKPSYTPPPAAKSWGDPDSLPDHFARHGKDFNANNPNDYAAKAWLFLQRAIDEGLPAKLDESDGTVRIWEGKTHTFAAYNRNFTTKTFFKPNSADYFTRQPGKPVRLRRPDPKP